MRIAYLINHNISVNDGVTKKILGQISEWEKQGNIVVVFCTTPKVGESILPAKQYAFKSYLKSRLYTQPQLILDIKTFSPDVIYTRYDTWSRSLSKLMKKYKVITEINTNDLEEHFFLMKKDLTLKSILRYISYYVLRSRVLSNVDGIVTVTKEIMNLFSIKKYNKPSVYVPNGIDLTKFDTIKFDMNLKTALFFIGTPNQSWHGVDLIEHLANQLSEFDFHIVGIDGESKKNIFYHGYLEKEKYIDVLKKCHICIGSLALHRINMSEASPLKVREYLAYGYPTIVGYEDTAFLDVKLPIWLKKIDVKNLNIDEIRRFIRKNKEVVLSHQDVFHYISSTVTEKNRLEFMSRVLDD